MAEYTLSIRIPQAGNHEVSYRLPLGGLYESYPEDYFRNEQHRDALCQFIQDQSKRQVTPRDLDAMISKWVADIRCGMYRTVVTLELPSETYGTAGATRVSPINSATPSSTPLSTTLPSTTQFSPKQPQTRPMPKPATTTTQPSSIPTTLPQKPVSTKTPDAEKPVEETPQPPDIRTDTNRAEF